MRRTLIVLLMTAVFVSAACGDDDVAEPIDPADIDSCEGAADAMIQVLEDTLVIVDSLTGEELAALGSDDLPPDLVAVQSRGEVLVERAGVLGCADEQMAALLAARADGLSSDSVFGQFVIETIRAGGGTSFLGG